MSDLATVANAQPAQQRFVVSSISDIPSTFIINKGQEVVVKDVNDVYYGDGVTAWSALLGNKGNFASLNIQGKQAYDTVTAQALRRVSTALASRNTAPCDVLHIGNSITWDLKAGALATRWASVFRDTLRRLLPNTTPVTGGFGFISSVPNFGAAVFSDAMVVNTGGASAGSNFGLDQNGWVLTASGHHQVYTFTGTGFDIFYAQFGGGGTFTYTVDGGSAVTINTAGATVWGQRNQVIRSLSVGSHTVRLDWVSGTVYATGGFAYNGDESVGIRSWVAAWPSTTSAYWWDTTKNYWLDSIANVQPDLVTIELGPNDYGAATPVSVATFKSNVQSIISTIKTKAGYSPSFILIPTWPLVPGGTPLATWSSYVTAMYEIALADPTNVCVWDLQARTATTTGTTIGGLLDADFTHPSVIGDRFIGEGLASFVLQ